MQAWSPGLRIGAAVGFSVALASLGPQVWSNEPDGGGGAGPEITATRGFITYRTNSALLPDFVQKLAQITGLELYGLELLERTRLSPVQGSESVSSLIARLLEAYNYGLALGVDAGTRAGATTGTLVIAGRKGSPDTPVSREPS